MPAPIIPDSKRSYYTAETLRSDLDQFETRTGISSEAFAAAYLAKREVAGVPAFDAHVWLATYEDWQRLSRVREVTPKFHRPSANSVICTLVIIASILTAALLWTDAARARSYQTQPQPIAAPKALMRERAQCQATKRHETCLRGKLRTAYEALEWARKERHRRDAPYGVPHALKLASALYGVPLRELKRVGMCESHLTPSSKNRSSTASGLFQFLDSTWNRAGVPGFSVFDPYANAIAAARLVRSDGSWREWSCQP